MSSSHSSTLAAVEAYRRGFTPVPIRTGQKAPMVSGWTHLEWSDADEVRAAFDRWTQQGGENVGLVLGTRSGDLVDIDLDHPKAIRLKDYFLPPTPMRSGRPGRPNSHFWYRTKGVLPGTRSYKMPGGGVSVELRSLGAQTVIPPSTHPSGEQYRWEGEPWGGEAGPADVDAQTLRVQVALLGLGAVLLDGWPKQGGRHDAYLALAGGLLRFGDGVHPWWEKNLPVLIRAMALATNDSDGPNARVGEVMGTTVARLRAGAQATGFTTLAEKIGNDHAEQARRMAREVESLSGYKPRTTVTASDAPLPPAPIAEPLADTTLPPEERDPLSERVSTWQHVDLEPYLAGEVRAPEPTVLRREDGKGLFYEGRVNSLYGRSEAAKSWVATIACLQEMAAGERVLYLDLEDEPTFTIKRLQYLGAGTDDIRLQFTYIRPEDPHMDMQRNRWGSAEPSDAGRTNAEVFAVELDRIDPSLIIVDGMTVLYGLHGLDSNDAASTDVITTWLKRLCRNGRSTVIVIDHTGKGAGRGASPIGAHHKIAMVQGTAIQVHPIDQPMPGELGRVELIIYKDRPGEVRKISTRGQIQTAAIVELDSRIPDETRSRVCVPDPDEIVVGDDDAQMARAVDKAARKRREAEQARAIQEAEQARMRQAVLDVFAGDLDLSLSRRQIELALPQDEPATGRVKALLKELVEADLLCSHGMTKNRRYCLSD